MSTSVAPGSVVVGVDGSPFSDAAVRWAVDYATAHHAPLCLLHGAGDLGGDQVPFRQEGREMLLTSSRKVTDHANALVRELAPGLDVEICTPLMDAREALLGVEHAAMIVVGTRGRGPLASLLLGSVSQAVASHATCPVTVVRPAEGRDDEARAKVVVGVDLDGSAHAPLDVAFEIASKTDRGLEVLYAWPEHGTVAEALADQQRREMRERRQRDLADTTAGFADRYPDVEVRTRIVDEAPAVALAAASQTAAHVVVGTRGHGRLPRRLVSVSRAVVEHAHCPVTVVGRERPADRDER